MKEKTEFIKKLIGRADLKTALSETKEIVLGEKDLEQDLLLLEARFQRYQKAIHNDVIDRTNQTEINRISNALIHILDDINERENKEEKDQLIKLNDTLALKKVTVNTQKIYYKRFRTGELFELNIQLEILTKELKDRLIKSVMPDYFKIHELKEVFGFRLMNAIGPKYLEDTKSLFENGIQSGDTVFLRRYFIYGSDEE